MSATQHQSAARTEARRAYRLQAMADSLEVACPTPEIICWDLNSTPQSFEADEARHLAREHRQAAAALRDAEAQSCRDVAPSDRDLSPFFHTSAVRAVEPRTSSDSGAKAGNSQSLGVRVTFGPVRGLTLLRLEALVRCHLARSASVGFKMPEMAYCPLAVRGASATVSDGPDGLTVTVNGQDSESAREILKRAKLLQLGAER